MQRFQEEWGELIPEAAFIASDSESIHIDLNVDLKMTGDKNDMQKVLHCICKRNWLMS